MSDAVALEAASARLGGDNASDYDDDRDGWFGWQVTDDGRLIVTRGVYLRGVRPEGATLAEVAAQLGVSRAAL